ncbi:MAG: ABC transporter permease subunit, partial [Ignisphaera sp.]
QQIMDLNTLFQMITFIVVRGFTLTLVLTMGSFLLGLGLGTLISFLQIVIGGLIGKASDIAVRFLRSIPPILILFIIFYGLKVDNVLAAIIGLGLISASYQSQIIRGIAETVAVKQFEAAISIGLNRWSAFASIIVPQTMLLAIPALLNEFAALLKDSSIAYAIGVKEMFTLAVNLANARMEYATPLIAIALVYLGMCLSVSFSANYIANRLKYMGYGVAY